MTLENAPKCEQFYPHYRMQEQKYQFQASKLHSKLWHNSSTNQKGIRILQGAINASKEGNQIRLT